MRMRPALIARHDRAAPHRIGAARRDDLRGIVSSAARAHTGAQRKPSA